MVAIEESRAAEGRNVSYGCHYKTLENVVNETHAWKQLMCVMSCRWCWQQRQDCFNSVSIQFFSTSTIPQPLNFSITQTGIPLGPIPPLFPAPWCGPILDLPFLHNSIIIQLLSPLCPSSHVSPATSLTPPPYTGGFFTTLSDKMKNSTGNIDCPFPSIDAGWPTVLFQQ